MPYTRARFRHHRVRAPDRFVATSLRTVTTGTGGRVVVGHLKGEHARTRGGRRKLSVQAVLTPKPKARRNPWLALMNRGTPIGSGVREVVYDRHATHGKGPWVHAFKRGDVEVRGLPSGAAVLASRAGAKVWSRDGGAGWLANPGRLPIPPGIGLREFVEAVDRLGAAAVGKALRWDTRTVRRKYADVTLLLKHGGYTPEEFQRFKHLAHSNKGGRVARQTHRKTKRRPPRGFKTWSAYMASIRPNSPKRKTRRHRAHTHKGDTMARHRSRARRNDPGRRRVRHHLRHYRHNPPRFVRGIGGVLLDGVKGGALVVAGKIVARAVPQFLGVAPIGPMGLGVQTVSGGAVYFLLDRFVGRELARPFLYGVFGNAIESLVRGANVPILSPSLGDETELHALAGYVPAGVAGYVPRGVAGMGDAGEQAGAPMLVMA